MPVIMSPKPKRVRTFIINGQVYEGGAEEYFNGNNLGGTRSPNGVLPQTEGNKEEKKK